jgi:dynein heavy chain
MPTARKFHYQFNLRDFSKVIQTVNLASPGLYKGKPTDIIRLWAHECDRVWFDRLIFPEDRDAYRNWMTNALKEFGELGKPEVIFEQPLIYTSFVAACEGHEAAYLPIASMEKLKEILEAKLEEYNEAIATMNLVLFN